MTYYRELAAMDEPADIGLDESDRPQVTFNLMGVKRVSATFLEELTTLLQNAPAIVALGSTLFLSNDAQLPTVDTATAFLVITEHKGPRGLRTQNLAGVAYTMPIAHISARAQTYRAARTLAWAAHARLSVVRNTDVSPTVIP